MKKIMVVFVTSIICADGIDSDTVLMLDGDGDASNGGKDSYTKLLLHMDDTGLTDSRYGN